MFYKKIDFSRFSSIKIGQIEEVMILEKGDIFPQDRFLVGGANNLLISPTPPLLMMLGKEFAAITHTKEFITIGAAMPTGRILSYAKKYDLGGFEFCSKLPGTLGGMLAMNAGVKRFEIFNILHSIQIDGEWRDKKHIEYGYRYAKLGGIATAARFETKFGFDQNLFNTLLSLRSNQPHDPSAGSAFKNPPGDYAGRLIEAVGLKGFRMGGMAWSEVHSNFLVNLGGGTYEEAIYLLTLAKEKVHNTFGIILQEEIKIL